MENLIYSAFWQEKAHKENPFSAEECFCYGYNVYEDLLPNANWMEYILLLFKKGDKASKRQLALFDKLAIFLANPGPRDPSVQAAMCSAVSKTTASAVLTSSLVVGGGMLGGGLEVSFAMEQFKLWKKDGIPSRIEIPSNTVDSWLPFEHVPGFDPSGDCLPQPVENCLHLMDGIYEGGTISWLRSSLIELQEKINYPLAKSGLAAAVFLDLGIESFIAEQCYMMLRLPGVIAHAQEQQRLGYRKFPFYQESLQLQNDPGEYKGRLK